MSGNPKKSRTNKTPATDAASLRQHAVSLLARRDHARAELRMKMTRKFGAEAAVQSILDWCEEHDFLNDRRFAGFFVRSRIERGQGPLRIRAELLQRGVAKELIEEAMRAADCDWFALAVETHQRRFRGAPSDRKEKARQLRFLQSRGFDAEQSFNALTQSGATLDE